MICTIYLLTNKINNKVYIGQTWLPLKVRMGPSGSNYKNSVYLYSAIKKYGSENFVYHSLAYCETQKEADITEVLFISQYNSRNSKVGYNLKEGGSVGKHSAETKAKIAESIRNKVWSLQALINKGKAGKAWKGKKRGPMATEHKALVIKTLKSGQFLGHHHSEEAKDKIRKASTGRIDSPETTKKRSLAQLMNSEREQNIIKAYSEGKIITDIVSAFNTGRASIYRILKRNNIVKRTNK